MTSDPHIPKNPPEDLSEEIFTSAPDPSQDGKTDEAPEETDSKPLSSTQELHATKSGGRLDQTILGRYQIMDILGRGAFSVVYRASQTGVGRVVALKVFLLHPASRQNQKLAEAALVRFQREARLASQLRHPNTVTLFDYDKTDTSIFYMAFEYVEGPTLSKEIKSHRAGISPDRVISIARQVALSLQEAHEQGIIHRDLKPGNIMLTTRRDGGDMVKVLDFGIAKLMEDSEAEVDHTHADLSDELELLDLTGLDQNNNADLTLDGRIVGTPRYIPPEQIQSQRIGPPADLYALGLILHEMLTGQSANPGKNAQDLIRWHLEDGPFSQPDNFNYPPGLAHIIQKATQRQADDRYQSCTEFIADLDRLDERGHWIKTKRLSRNVIIAIIANIILIAGIASLIALSLQPPETQPSQTQPAAIPEQPTQAAPPKTAPPKIAPKPKATPKPPAPAVTPTPTPIPAPRTLDLKSKPDGAQVYLGDTRLGITPFTLTLEDKPRDMVFTLKKKGYWPKNIAWKADKDAPSPFPATLRRKTPKTPNKANTTPKYRVIQ